MRWALGFLFFTISAVAFAETTLIAPSDVKAVNDVPNEALVTWKDNSNNEGVFDIQRRVGSGPYYLRGSVSRNMTQYRDKGVSTSLPVYYRVRARYSSKYFSAFSPDGMLGPLAPISDVSSKWDFIDSIAVMSLSNPAQYLGADPGKQLVMTLELGSNWRSQAFTTVPVSFSEKYDVSYLVSDSEMAELFVAYPNGAVPFRMTYEVTHNGVRTFIYRGNGQILIRKKQDNTTYRIAFFHVAEPGVDLSKLNVCLKKDSALGGDGYAPIGSVVPDCVAKWDWGSNAATITTRSYPVLDLLFGTSTTRVEDLTTISNERDRRAGGTDVFSLRLLGNYWRDLLVYQGATATKRLGKNPRFQLEILPIVYAPNTLKTNDHATVKAFFAGVAKNAGIDLSGYDFVIHGMYYPKGYGANEFVRAFAAGRNSFISLDLSSDKIIFNSLFLTIAHELGHQIFSLPDRYDGFGIQYPNGVPAAGAFPKKQACLMAKGFAWELASPTLARSYSTSNYTDAMQTNGLARFHTEDPRNQVLCEDDLKRILGQ